MPPSRRHHGLTLIEVILVVAIIALTTMISVPVYTKYRNQAEIDRSIADIQKIDSLIVRHQLNNYGTLPDSLNDIGSGPWIDPWDNEYQYLNHAIAKGKGKLRKDKNLVSLNSVYDLYSMGKDGRSVLPLTAKHSRDDIVRANKGGLIRLESDYYNQQDAYA